MHENELLNNLRFINCKTRNDVFLHVDKLAKELITNWKIVTPKGEHRFLGLEFYLIIPNLFVDPSTHKRDEQLESGTFYFHSNSKGDWTPPIINRHGVDITCGDVKRGIYGGILLRHISGEGHRDGSGLALRSLVRGDDGFKKIPRGSHDSKWSEEEKAFLEDMNRKSIFDNEIYLKHCPLLEEVSIAGVERVNVDDSILEHYEKLGFRRVQ